jgi:SAM-dependent methyltransferase
MSPRRDKLLARIKPESMEGLEIGPLDRPSVTSAHGSIRYVDFATTEELRQQRKNDPTVNVDNLAPVHFIWGDKTLGEAVGGAHFDYVVASHVVEHVPDLIGWFQELAEVLKPGGVVSLVVPDRRYTFDRIRPETRTPEVVEAWLEHHRRPSYRQIFEHYALHTRVDVEQAWAGTLDESRLERMHPESYALQVCQEAVQSKRYVDSHCWVFTPTSFFGVIRSLCELGLFAFEVVEFFAPTRGEIDFFVTFQKAPEHLDAAALLARQLRALPGKSDAPARAAAPPPQPPAAPVAASNERRERIARLLAEALTNPLATARKVRSKVRHMLGV